MPDKPEIEVKFIVAEPDAFRQTLRDIGAVFESKHVESNIRLDDPNGSLAAKGIVLRVRSKEHDQDLRAELTIKTPIPNSPHGLSARREIETRVADAPAVIAALGVLGFSPYFRYEKRREVYRHKGLEIDLDELPYGWFVELEGSPEDIHATVSALGLNRADGLTISYTQMFENVKEALHLTMDNLTFEAFEGVAVDPAALRGK